MSWPGKANGLSERPLTRESKNTKGTGKSIRKQALKLERRQIIFESDNASTESADRKIVDKRR
ncbi:hypothetical protein ACS49_04600 [Bacillus cereus]|nr:hypothetical protein ACS49_04600 [Bacillus cereus]